MIQARQDLRFTLEARHALGVLGERVRTGGFSPRTISRKLRLARALGSLARRLNRVSQAGVSPTGNVK